MSGSKPCRFINRPGGCRFGASCKFSHAAHPGSAQTHRSLPSGQKREVSSSEAEFRTWRFLIPKDGDPVVPLGPELSKFFQKSAELVSSDTGTLQDVISRLASPGGLSRIREMVEQEVSSLSGSMKLRRFLSQHVPFFKALTHPDVLSSILLEQPLAGIFTTLYGIGGQRAVKVFSFTAEVLDVLVEKGALAPSYAPSFSDVEIFNASFQVLAMILDHNGGAPIHEELRDLVRILSASHDRHVEALGEALCYRSTVYLAKMQQRLGVGHAIPQLQNTPKIPSKETSFNLQIDPPGALSPKGPRHDNDHEDIRRIDILPTWEEVNSHRPEYLPMKDPDTWHKAGIQGLLDRHFRLLREDTVGQLRDVIQLELQHMNEPDGHTSTRRGRSQGLRTYTYYGVNVTDLSVQRRDGLRCQVSFDQPGPVRSMTASKRQEWWSKTRRLQADALVCLLDKTGLLLFCSVIMDDKKPAKLSETEENGSKKDGKFNLHANGKVAYLTLNLAVQDDHSANDLLRRCHKPQHMTLVEFPGVLLPAFKPTLEALQQMAKSEDVPFPEFLAPDDSESGLVHVPPPTYSRAPGFRFNLRTILEGNRRLHLPTQSAFNIKQLSDGSSLDDAQAHAVVDALSRNLALIQGPPGTGKSYTGIALIKVLLDNRADANLGPILCVCYTNHALDQLLEHLVDAGISQIIRVGSRSKSEVLEPLMLRNVARKMEGTKAEKRRAWELGGSLENDEKELHKLIDTFSFADSWSSIKQYLNDYLPSQHDELFGGHVDEEGFEYPGRDPRAALSDWLRGGAPALPGHQQRPISALESIPLLAMSNGERRKIHNYWVQRLRGTAQHQLVQALREYNDRRTKYLRNRMELDLRCLQQARVIGITTSGLARNLDILRRIRTKVMICEEAGEVLESHTLTAMLPSVEHAILIGDHLQLRPQIQRHDLGREHPRGEQYSSDVSLFERLVQPNSTTIQLPFTTLETQRRMHPMISQLVRDTLYPSLKDAPSTETYPMIPGMKHRLFWFDHREFEASSDESQGVATTSHTNEFEIDMTLGLVSHLMKQGAYHAEDIAVLTPYLGQLHKLRAKLGKMWELVLNDRDIDQLEQAGMAADEVPQASKSSALKALKVATIDNFQGEEAKVVVISLVRSNPNNKCGFLRTSNRINVLLSRAQHGMFLIGNSETAGSVQMWADVLDILRLRGNFGPTLELQCPRHPNNPIEVKRPEDFTQFSPEGGCNKKCDKRLRCGHSCINKCHSSLLHDAVVCLEPCPRPMKGCDHSCPQACGEKCPKKCVVTVHDPFRILPCGHFKADLPCWQSQDLSTVACTTKVSWTILGCQHEVELPCHIDSGADSFQCPARCDVVLQCGHTCKNKCSTCKTRENGEVVQEDHGICKQVCGRDYSTCRHSCKETCHGDKPCPLCAAPCENSCSHSRCNKKCHEPCSPCAQKNCDSCCPHSQCSLPCAAPCDWLPCSKRCVKQLSCGHQCPSLCGEACPDKKFCQVCAEQSIKDMQVDYIEMLTYKEVDLDSDPCLFPQCGHIMTVQNMDGHMDMAKHYIVSPDGAFTGLHPSPPFSNDELKHCPTCRGSLRNICRYGRIIRRALLDESTKKFIVWSHNEYVALQAQFQAIQDQLVNTADAVVVDTRAPMTLNISKTPSAQLKQFREAAAELTLTPRFKDIFALRNRIQTHVNKASKEEQPFKRVYNSCQDARRRRQPAAGPSFQPHPEVPQTRAHLLGSALLIRCDLAILGALVSAWRDKLPSRLRAACVLDLAANRQRCAALLHDAQQGAAPLQCAEALLFLAHYAAVERPFAPACQSERLRADALAHVARARGICAAHPGATGGMGAEADAVEGMLVRAETFFAVVTGEERRAVLAAMATEMRGTGHWYTCARGHPFTVGECGMPMQQTRCPQCGAAVGGRDHAPAEGVRRAEELEAELRELRL